MKINFHADENLFSYKPGETPYMAVCQKNMKNISFFPVRKAPYLTARPSIK